MSMIYQEHITDMFQYIGKLREHCVCAMIYCAMIYCDINANPSLNSASPANPTLIIHASLIVCARYTSCVSVACILIVLGQTLRQLKSS